MSKTINASSREQLKALTTRLTKAKVVYNDMQEQKKTLEETLKTQAKVVNSLNQQIASIGKDRENLVVTEHAILRYLEKVSGVDIAQVEANIITRELQEQVSVIGNGTFPLEEGFSVVVRDGVVLTVKEA